MRVLVSDRRPKTLNPQLETSQMKDAATRPFYGEYAWAYDLLLARPAARNCARIAELLSGRGSPPGSRLLDAGCGPGGYSVELARLGYLTTGVDLSAQLLDRARERAASARPLPPVSFVRADILALPFAAAHDAILCRGVLNDLTDDESRRAVFNSFAQALRPGGLLLLDVREWEATARRKALEPAFETSADTPRGRLTFRSLTRLDRERRLLLVSEEHTLKGACGETVSLYDFVMRCWTRDELQENLTRAGFADFAYLGGYDPASPAGSSDRLVCLSRRN